uniref:Uncharacterized protein n=1 Tax=Setaria italica TaxID=4555 RepID=K3ZW20_SETIT
MLSTAFRPTVVKVQIQCTQHVRGPTLRTYVRVYALMKGAPVRYSVKASATSPSMAKRPFQSSASALMTPPLLASALSPFRRGTSDATESTAAVAANQASPDPLPACERRPPPRDASTASADTKPTMASRPLMRSGAGPLNASASHSPGLAGFFAALGFGVGVAADGVEAEEEDAGLVSSVVGSASSAWALTTCRARRRGASADAGTRTGNPPARAPPAAKDREPMDAITVAAIGVGGARVRWIGDRIVSSRSSKMLAAVSVSLCCFRAV